MTHATVSEMIARAKFEGVEFMDRTGEGITALFRLLLILGMLLLLGIASFLNLLDEQLTKESHQWQRQQ